MAITIQAGYKLITGWVSRSQLYTNGSDIRDLPVQSDMTHGRKWIRPGNVADIIKPASLLDSPSGQRFGQGGLIFKWPMVNMSPGMTKYLQETYFSPSVTPSSFFYRTWSNKLTVQTYNRASGIWEAYHTYGRFADFESEAEPALGGYNEMMINFTAFAVAPDGPDLVINVTYPETIYDRVNFTFNVTADNDGDAITWGTNTINYTVPSQLDFVSVSSSASLTITYSVNNGTSYSATPPGDLTTVTNVRVIYGATIAAGATSSTVNFTVTPNAVATGVNNVVSFTTQGDTDTSSDTDTETFNIVAFTPGAYAGLTDWQYSTTIGNLYQDSGATTPVASDTDPVGHWTDNSSVGTNDFIQATGGNRPAYRTAGINSLPSVEFDGLTEYLTSGALNAFVTTSALTVFVVFNVTASDTNAATANDDDAIFADEGGFFGLHVKSTLDLVAYMYDGTDRTITSTYTAGVDHLAEVRLSSGVFSLVKDNAARSTLGSVSAITDISNNLQLGQSNTVAAELFNGLISEFITYNVALSDTESSRVRLYLNEKYGIY